MRLPMPAEIAHQAELRILGFGDVKMTDELVTIGPPPP
jgi:hypothetical protein